MLNCYEASKISHQQIITVDLENFLIWVHSIGKNERLLLWFESTVDDVFWRRQPLLFLFTGMVLRIEREKEERRFN